ncbi:MAG: Ig-like domain-containing protein, partial [Planctomycetota bacterium]|nr:Ig-like domain-containing protein [Planctomycetota bacterium]
ALLDGETVDDTFDYTVSDGNGGTATNTITITVTGLNDAPVAVADSESSDEDTTVDVDITDNDFDPDLGDTFSMVTFDDTSTSGAVITDNGDGTLNYDPRGSAALNALPEGETATDTFTYTIEDANGLQAVGTVTVTVSGVNDDPSADADTAATDADTATGGSLSGLVDDPDTGDTLGFSPVSGTSAQGAAFTIDADTGAWTYDPSGSAALLALLDGETVVDTFDYTVSDGNGGTATNTITITVTGVNDAPVAVDDTGATDEDTAVDVDVTDNDSDPDLGDTFSMVTFDDTSTSGAVITDNGDGTLNYDPSNSAILNALPEGETVADTFTYTIEDAAGLQAVGTVTVTVTGVNDDPTAAADTGSTDADTATDGSLSGLVDDPDTGDTLGFSPTSGTSAQGAAVTIDPTTGAWTYDPSGAAALTALGEGETIDDTFDYTVSDGNGGTATNTITVTVTGLNDAPVAVEDTDSTDEETAVDIDVTDNDYDPDLTDTFDLVVFDDTSTSGAVITDNGDGTLKYDPSGVAEFNELAVGETATDTFTYTIEDASGVQAVGTVTVTVNGVNDAPVAEADPIAGSIEVSDDQDVVLDVLANDSDIDGDDIRILSVDDAGLDGSIVIDPSELSLTYTPSGTDNGITTFTYTITDDNGGTDTATVTLNVVGNQDPEPLDDEYTITENEVLNDNVLDNDSDPDAGDTLTVTAQDTVWQAGSDLVGDPPTINADGSFEYDPRLDHQFLAAGESRQGVFEYTVEDDAGVAVTAQVTITVTGVNDAPTAGPLSTGTTADTAIGGSLTGLVNDVDTSDILTYGSDSATSTLGADVSVNPTSGAWDYDPSGAAALIALAQGEVLQDTFTYTVEDNNGGTAFNTITINVIGVNDDPTAGADTASVDADATTGGSLAGLVNDPDTNDTLQYTQTGAAPLGGVDINLSTGAWTYDPTGVAAFEALAAGESAQDTFSYTVSDGNGGTASNTVTITVNGVNEAPTAVDDSDSVMNNDTTIIDLLDNDTDPDANDVLSVDGIDDSLTNGSVSDNGDGTVTYDPSGWAAAQALAPGAQLTDTFEYSVSDGNGGNDTATVTVTVTGAGAVGDPVVTNPIADRIVFDSEAQPITYDLATVFSDDGPLVYAATSSNTDMVQVDVTGSILSITYSDYESLMDRTPAVIEVTATEDGGTAFATDVFVVTVVPETTVDVQLIVRETATPVGETSTDTLPDSLSSVIVGQNYVVEIWMADSLDSSVTTGPISTGLTGAEFDLNFDQGLGQGLGVHHEGPYDNPSFIGGAIDNGQGLVDDFEGGTLEAGYGIDGNYVRLGYIDFSATATGDQTFSLDFESAARRSNESGAGQVVQGNIDGSQVTLPTITISQHEVTTFDIDIVNASNVTIDGVCYGLDLEPQLPGSAFSTLTGTIDTILQYDDITGEVSSIQILGASISATDLFGDDLEPGVGGASGSAPANVGLKDATTAFNLALRNMGIDVVSDGVIQLPGTQIDSSKVSYSLTSGNFDLRTTGIPEVPTSESLTGRPLYEDTIIPGFETPMGTITKIGNTIDLTLNFEKFLDLSDITIGGDYLTFNANLTARYIIPAMTATQTSQTAAAADETDLVMTLSKHATALDADGQVDTLPISEAWVDEWDSYWVEIWARTGEGSGINAAGLDLSYNGDYFTAVEVQHGRAFT